MADEGNIYADYSGMQEAAEDMLQQTQGMDALIQQLNAEIAPMMASWGGEDQRRYDPVQKRWNQAVENLKTNLAGHSETLGRIHQNYGHGENRLAAQWEDVQIG